MKEIKDTKFYSKKLGRLPKGCQLCVKGQKTVLFITGICPRNCSYCPISDQKHQNDVTFANEWQTNKIQDIIQEAKMHDSKGVGVTGGDPLVKLDRTIKYIKALKQEFGKGFHIHLYTSFNLATKQTLKKLHDAGLDEIRFHPDLDNNKLWNTINNAINPEFKWDVGIEIPVIPGKLKQTKFLMEFMNKKIKFMNLNELEVSDAKANRLTSQGYKTKSDLSYAIKGSENTANKLLKFAQTNNLSYNIHFCTATLKDKVQLTNRIKRRAKNAAESFDIINKDGTITRGAIYLSNNNKRIQILEKVISMLKSYDVPDNLLKIEKDKLRVITNPGVVIHFTDEIKELSLKPAIVTEFPTWDKMIIELDWL